MKSNKSSRKKLMESIKIAIFAHEGQFDLNGDLYILHPLSVMNSVQGDLQKSVAVLHDVIEDTNISEDFLRSRVGEEIASLVSVLSHNKNESYDEYIKRVSIYPIAVDVKISDLIDNLKESRKLLKTESSENRRIKYKKALIILRSSS